MEIVVTGRHVQVSDRFRSHLAEKLTKVPQLAPRVQRIDVVVSHEANKRQAKSCERVELTCRVSGSVVRAEACLDDKYASLDVALDKLMERLRRSHDRARVHRGRRSPESVARATARIDAPRDGAGGLDGAPGGGGAADPLGTQGESVVEVREKIHASAPMGLDQAIREMELVGHDFYLFHDDQTDKPSVVYRRRGWSYGVIHLEMSGDLDAALADAPAAAVGTEATA